MEKQQIKTAPFQGYNGGCAGHITWEAHLKAWKEYADEYGGYDQPAETVAERGGFSAKELDKCFPDWKKYIIETL